MKSRFNQSLDIIIDDTDAISCCFACGSRKWALVVTSGRRLQTHRNYSTRIWYFYRCYDTLALPVNVFYQTTVNINQTRNDTEMTVKQALQQGASIWLINRWALNIFWHVYVFNCIFTNEKRLNLIWKSFWLFLTILSHEASWHSAIRTTFLDLFSFHIFQFQSFITIWPTMKTASKCPSQLTKKINC